MEENKNKLEFGKDYQKKLTQREKMVGSLILHLSLDGRLARLSLPHVSKRERIKQFMKIKKKFHTKLSRKDLDELWGKEIRSVKEFERLVKNFT